MPTVLTDSCSLRIGRFGTFWAASAAWRVIRRIAEAYGRSASIRCSARRRRAAATISIARVIFWMFLTEPMRLLTSFCAMVYAVAGSSSRSSSSEASSSPSADSSSPSPRERREPSLIAASSLSAWPSSSRS